MENNQNPSPTENLPSIHENISPESAGGVCPVCGERLADPTKACPLCLLKMASETSETKAESDHADFSEHNAAAPNAEAGKTASDGEKPAPPSVETLQNGFADDKEGFEILEMIGRGGMSAVYKARQPELDRFVAIKVLYGQLAQTPSFTERFRREAKFLARLSHPNIVTIHEFGSKNVTDESGREVPILYLVMEFVDGVNLRQAMRTERFTPEQALSLIPKICDALQYAHDEGVIHRDIKPENILLDVKGRIKLADFGISHQQRSGADETGSDSAPSNVELDGSAKDSARLTQKGMILGTPNYSAPEQTAAPASVDHRADIYSLGVVFYELLTGERPGVPIIPPSSQSDTPVELDRIVLRALEKDRARRQQSAEELKTEIESTLHPLGESDVSSPSREAENTASAQSVPEPPRRKRAKALFRVLCFIVLFISLAALLTAYAVKKTLPILMPPSESAFVEWPIADNGGELTGSIEKLVVSLTPEQITMTIPESGETESMPTEEFFKKLHPDDIQFIPNSEIMSLGEYRIGVEHSEELKTPQLGLVVYGAAPEEMAWHNLHDIIQKLQSQGFRDDNLSNYLDAQKKLINQNNERNIFDNSRAFLTINDGEDAVKISPFGGIEIYENGAKVLHLNLFLIVLAALAGLFLFIVLPFFLIVKFLLWLFRNNSKTAQPETGMGAKSNGQPGSADSSWVSAWRRMSFWKQLGLVCAAVFVAVLCFPLTIFILSIVWKILCVVIVLFVCYLILKPFAPQIRRLVAKLRKEFIDGD